VDDAEAPVRAPVAPPVPIGTFVRLDPSVRFFSPELIGGGSPWRLLRLRGRSVERVQAWRLGGVIQPGEDRLARTMIDQGMLTASFESSYDVTDVDVVIPVYNDATGLVTLLDQLRGLAVTVVDDGSANQRQIADIATKNGAHVVRHEMCGGPSGARNSGIGATARPLVWLVDADVTVGYGASTLRTLLTHVGDPKVAAVAPRILGARGRGVRGAFEERFGPLDRGPVSGLVRPEGLVPFVPGACLLVRRSAMSGGFDEALRVGEDVDFVWRLHDQGWSVRYDAGVTVHHRPRATVKEWVAQRHSYGRSASGLSLRHGSRLAPARVDALSVAIYTALLTNQRRAASTLAVLAGRAVERRLPSSTPDRSSMGQTIAVRGVVASGVPLARNLVRAYGPGLLVAMAYPRTRRIAATVWAVGTLGRYSLTNRPRLNDLWLGVADDLAYASGLWRGALADRNPVPLMPRVTAPVKGWRAAVPLLVRPPSGAGADN
jgi:mycofactocin glycosyltransferase